MYLTFIGVYDIIVDVAFSDDHIYMIFMRSYLHRTDPKGNYEKDN